MKTKKAATPQKDYQPVPVATTGNLYEVNADKTDILWTFWQKCGWIGPEMQRRLAAFQKGDGHANS